MTNSRGAVGASHESNARHRRRWAQTIFGTSPAALGSKRLIKLPSPRLRSWGEAGAAGAGQSRKPLLDILRGAAVLLVMLRHAWPEVFPGAGIVGVVLFFVLSGYLITDILIRDIEQFGRIRYGRFYTHRAFRLLPALFAFVIVYAVVESLTDALGDRSDGTIVLTVVAALTYIKDIPLPFEVSQAIAPLWTLAVEEQFYLIWPALLIWAFRRRLTKNLIVVSTAVVLGLMLVSVGAVLVIAPDKFKHVYSLPTTWGVGLVAGSAARIYRDWALAWLGNGRRPGFALASAITLVCLCFFPNAQATPAFYVIGGPLIVITGCAIVLAGAQRDRSVRFAGPLLFLGKISYAAYLWNYLVLLWLNGGSAVGAPWWAAGGSICLTILLATASWHTVELLGRRGRRRFDEWSQARLTGGS